MRSGRGDCELRRCYAIAMSSGTTFRVRLRVRIGKPLISGEMILTTDLWGRKINIQPAEKDTKFADTEWIVFSCGGFETQTEAHQFGQRMGENLEIGAIASRLGVDIGDDKASGMISEKFAREVGLIKQHERLAQNVHGVMVIPDDDLTRIGHISGRASVTEDPYQLIDSLKELEYTTKIDNTLRASVRNLNHALVNRDPLAQLVLSISSVKALGQNENWTDRQRKILDCLASDLVSDYSEDDSEVSEVADTLKRGMHRIGLRQGVIRILQNLELTELKNEWDRVHGTRSQIFHGARQFSYSEIAETVKWAINLGGIVILKAHESKGIKVPSISILHYPK